MKPQPKPLRSGYRAGSPIGGPECEAFERELEAYYRVPFARVFNSGTSALHAAVLAQPEDFWYVPVYTMSATAAAVLHAGRKLVFADIGDDYCVKPPYPGRPSFNSVIQVHLFGRHYPALDARGFRIHDCAQSPTLRPDPHEPMDLWVYSLNQHKVIDCGEGGYVLTFDKGLADRLHLVRNHGEVTSPDILGYNFRMTEMQAAVARAEFAQLDSRIAARRAWAAELQTRWSLPHDPLNRDYFLYTFESATPEEAVKPIPGARIGYHRLLCDLPWYKRKGYEGKFPNARRIESRLVVVDPEVYCL